MEKSIGERLKECRIKRQWSQQELAELLHVTRQAVSNWERNKTLPDVYRVKEIASVFDLTLDEFMENTRQAEVTMPKLPGSDYQCVLPDVSALVFFQFSKKRQFFYAGWV